MTDSDQPDQDQPEQGQSKGDEREQAEREQAEHERPEQPEGAAHSSLPRGESSSAAQESPGDEQPQHAVRYDRREINLRGLLLVVAGVVVVIVVQLAVTRWLLHTNELRHQAMRKSNYPVAPEPSQTLPPEPRLEPLDRHANVASANVFQRQQAKERVLHSFGPANQPGFVHIPIQQAMTLTVDRLPVRSEPSDGQLWKGEGLRDGGESNSGRVFRRSPPQHDEKNEGKNDEKSAGKNEEKNE